MRGKLTKTEIENATIGEVWDQMSDPYQLKELAVVSTEELAQKIERQMRYTAATMVQCGRFLYAIKERLGHGEWEPFVQARQWSWVYVRGCMKFVDVYVKHPQALYLPPGRATNNLLRLPMAKIDQVLVDLPAEAIKKLTPWELSKIYDEQRKKGPPSPAKERQPAELPTELELLTTQALVALRQIEGLTIPKREWELAKQRCKEISIAWNHAAYNMYDPEHASIPPWELGNSDDISTDEEGEAGDEAR